MDTFHFPADHNTRSFSLYYKSGSRIIDTFHFDADNNRGSFSLYYILLFFVKRNFFMRILDTFYHKADLIAC